MPPIAPAPLSIAPYPGLRPFLHTEADIFFGREEQTDQLLKKLQTSHFLAVIGSSGCGKSSLVRAGMISALEAGFLTEPGARWRIAEMRPGERPLRRLTEALTSPSALWPEGGDPNGAAFLHATLQRGPLGLLEVIRETSLPEHTNLLLLVDQFEEIFRFREEGDPDEANAFVALLLATATQREAPVYVVITMRSEYLGHCALFSGLPEAMNEGQFLTPRLTREQSEAAITKPARVLGGRVDPSLVNRLLNDMGSDANQLPLLQHCLMRMWTRVNQRLAKTRPEESSEESPAASIPESNPVTLTLDDYLAVGTLDQALSTHADEVLNRLTNEQQRIAQVLFRRLTERSSGGQDTRHPTRLGDVAKVAGVRTDDVAVVVKEFRKPGRSFVTPPQGLPIEPGTVLDISHESLISLWRTLDKWAKEEADSATDYVGLKQTACLWAKKDADLLGAINLSRALAWKKKQEPTVEWALRYGSSQDFATTMAFLEASETRQALVKQEEERRRRNKLALGYGIALILGVAFIFAGFQWRRATAALNIAKSEKETQRRVLYDRNISLVQSRVSQGLFGQAVESLDILSDPASKDLRHFEFYYLWRLLHSEGEIVTLKGHTGGVSSLAASPDGKTLATGSENAVVKIWDTTTHQELATLTGHAAGVYSIAFSPDGKTIATGSDDNTVKLWDTTTHQELATLTGHTAGVYAIAFSPDGKTIATGSDDKTVKLWDAATHQQSATLTGHRNGVYAIAFSPDGKTLATGSDDKTVKLWNPGTHQQVATLTDHRAGVYAIAFSPDGKTLATGSGDKTVKLWDKAAHQLLVTLTGHTDGVSSLAYSPNGKTLATGSDDGTAKLWDTGTGQELITFSGHAGAVSSLAFSSDGRILATGSWDKTVKLWDAGKRQELLTLPCSEAVSSVALSPNGKILVSGSDDNIVKFWDTISRQESATLKGYTPGVSSVAFSPDGKTLAYRANNAVKLWDTISRQELATLGQTDGGYSLAFSADGKILASGSEDHAVKLWDTATREELATLKGQTGGVSSVAFSPDGKILASGSEDHTVKIWDTTTHQEFATLVGHSGGVSSLAFSPDGKILASGSEDHTVKLWDTRTHQELTTLTGHSAGVYCVAFSIDGKTLATGSDDKTVKLWDTGTLEELLTLTGHAGRVSSMVFSSDGRTLATGSWDKTVKLWIAATEDEMIARNK